MVYQLANLRLGGAVDPILNSIKVLQFQSATNVGEI